MWLQTGDERLWLAEQHRALTPSSIDRLVHSMGETDRAMRRPIAATVAAACAALAAGVRRAGPGLVKLARPLSQQAKPASAPSPR